MPARTVYTTCHGPVIRQTMEWRKFKDISINILPYDTQRYLPTPWPSTVGSHWHATFISKSEKHHYIRNLSLKKNWSISHNIKNIREWMPIYQYKFWTLNVTQNHLLLGHKEMRCTPNALLLNSMTLWIYKTNDNKDYYVTTVPHWKMVTATEFTNRHYTTELGPWY